ncbi:MAG: type III-B CRISPR module RAMP protein Cmr4 [Alcanivoracaceae bacterium]|nr:type III-B CRISPR module RAMP protein Cmr4 [Alcanivoracaceae bacterium]
MKNTLIALHAQTSIHAGTGQNTGTIDLPIQRESHNGYPCIYGSGMKGALRSCAEQRGEQCGIDKEIIESLFGPESGGDGYAGALLISDARLLLLPVRSLTSHYRWVTCPAILQRLKQDAKRFDTTFDYSIPQPENNQAMVQKNNDSPAKLFLEEYCFTTKGEDFSALVTILSAFIQYDEAETLLQNQLTIVSDNDFSHLSKNTTPVRARNVLNTDTKTSENLWYEETLPPETIMYMGVSADNARKKGSDMKSTDVLAKFKSLFTKDTPWLQVGGNETVGMGWFAVNFLQTDTKSGAE